MHEKSKDKKCFVTNKLMGKPVVVSQTQTLCKIVKSTLGCSKHPGNMSQETDPGECLWTNTD